jgi:archaemetzincin
VAILKAKIVLVPLGEVDFILVNRLATNIGPIFNRSVDILKGMKVPQESYNVIRGQNYASVILNKLEQVKANQREFILGLLEEDIYLPDEAYIIGHSDTVSRTAVVSLFRIRQEFYGLPEDDKKVFMRLFKQSIFHLAPLFNLPSCWNPRCINYYSQKMFDIDSKGEKFCDLCRRKLKGKK